MKVGIIHNSLNSTGGGERLCLETIKSLKETGYDVILATVEPTNWDRVERIIGEITKPDREVSLFKIRMRMFGIYMRLLTSFLASKLRKQCDIVLNTHGDVLPIEADIVYMHYPTFALLKESPINIKYSSSLFWRAYFIPYEGIQRFLVKRFLKSLILTNSKFSKKAIKKYTGKDATIVYPPVNVETFAFAAKSDARENLVISCGRYSPEKNYEFILEVAERLKNRPIRFIIVGASSGRVSREYYEKLERIRQAKRLKNVELLRDLDFSKLLALYGKAKIYLHAMKYEHFGMSIVEAMAAGLVPIVHRSGGPWEDILKAQQGRHGFSYLTADEAAWLIEDLIENEHTRKEIVSRNREHVHMFSSESYQKKILSIIENYRSLGGSKVRIDLSYDFAEAPKLCNFSASL